MDCLSSFILSPANLNAAYKKVKGSKGSGGIDGMSTEGLLPYLKEHGSKLVASLCEGQEVLLIMEPPYAERHVRWCERTLGELILMLLLDYCSSDCLSELAAIGA